MSNPRRANGSRRTAQRAYWRSLGLPCALCGRAIDYSLGMTVDKKTGRARPHPMSFVIDEIKPTSRWQEFGYPSPEAAALDIDNQQPAHWICNARKGNRMPTDGRRPTSTLPLPQPREF